MKKLIILPFLGLLAACENRVGDFITTACVNGKQYTLMGTVRESPLDTYLHIDGEQSRVFTQGDKCDGEPVTTVPSE